VIEDLLHMLLVAKIPQSDFHNVRDSTVDAHARFAELALLIRAGKEPDVGEIAVLFHPSVYTFTPAPQSQMILVHFDRQNPQYLDSIRSNGLTPFLTNNEALVGCLDGEDAFRNDPMPDAMKHRPTPPSMRDLVGRVMNEFGPNEIEEIDDDPT
jgi:hypothetical protein